jgi:hypothetical protein
LEVEIARFGALPLPARQQYRIKQVELGTRQLEPKEEQQVRDAFAPGQFFEMSDDEKLSRPAFEPLPSGYTRLGVTGMQYPSSVTRTATFHYDTVVIDKKDEIARRDKGRTGEKCQVSGEYHCQSHPSTTISLGIGQQFPLCSATNHATTWAKDYTILPVIVPVLARLGAAAESPMRQTGSARFAGPSQKVVVKEPAYAVASAENLAVTTTAMSYVEAETARREMGGDGAGWQVVGAHEVEG